MPQSVTLCLLFLVSAPQCNPAPLVSRQCPKVQPCVFCFLSLRDYLRTTSIFILSSAHLTRPPCATRSTRPRFLPPRGYRWLCSVRARLRLLSNQSVRYDNMNLLVLTLPPIMLDQGQSEFAVLQKIPPFVLLRTGPLFAA